MRRTLAALAPLLLLAACQSAAPSPSAAYEESSSGPGAVDYAMVLPENVVWVPWKIVGGTLKGGYDGVASGFTPERLPVLGALFSPLNLAFGTVTGLGKGLVEPPLLMGPSDDFGREMGRPLSWKTPVWWY